MLAPRREPPDPLRRVPGGGQPSTAPPSASPATRTPWHTGSTPTTPSCSHAAMRGVSHPLRVEGPGDGQFFERARHVAGGRAVSLNDIEHRILRGRLPRAAHPLRHQLRLEWLPAHAPAGLRGGRTPGDARRRHPPVPRQRVELPGGRRRRARSSSRASSGCTRRTLPATPTPRWNTGAASSASWPSTTGLALVTLGERYRARLQHLRLGPQRRRTATRGCAPSPSTRASKPSTRPTRAARALPLRRQLLQPRPAPGARCSVSPGLARRLPARVLDARARPRGTRREHRFLRRRAHPARGTASSEAMRHLRAEAFRGLFSIFLERREGPHPHPDARVRTRARRRVLNYSIYLGCDAEPLPEPSKTALEGVGARASHADVLRLQGAVTAWARAWTRLSIATARATITRSRAACSASGAQVHRRVPCLSLRGRERGRPLPAGNAGYVAGRSLRELPAIPRPGPRPCWIPPRAPGDLESADDASATWRSCPPIDARRAQVRGGPRIVVRVPHPEGPVRALDGISFDVRRGEFLSIVGPSGAARARWPCSSRASCAPPRA